MEQVLIVDNDDSFVYNIVEMLRPLASLHVVKHNALPPLEGFNKILLSPGAGLPTDYPAMMELLRHPSPTRSILGICLGHQAIALSFGAKLRLLSEPKHGHCSTLTPPLLGICTVGRYHSWVVDEADFPPELLVTSRDEEGNIMSLRHRTLPVTGVQFHPESIITAHGVELFRTWISGRETIG
ncbi:MAG: aminodeoxychorismate/anthranilate synthase component II [Bacteroides sp.]